MFCKMHVLIIAHCPPSAAHHAGARGADSGADARRQHGAPGGQVPAQHPRADRGGPRAHHRQPDLDLQRRAARAAVPRDGLAGGRGGGRPLLAEGSARATDTDTTDEMFAVRARAWGRVSLGAAVGGAGALPAVCFRAPTRVLCEGDASRSMPELPPCRRSSSTGATIEDAGGLAWGALCVSTARGCARLACRRRC